MSKSIEQALFQNGPCPLGPRSCIVTDECKSNILHLSIDPMGVDFVVS
jgi:hypothetical protein